MKKDNKKVKLELEILELESRLAPQKGGSPEKGDYDSANGCTGVHCPEDPLCIGAEC